MSELEARLQNELNKEPDYEPEWFDCIGNCGFSGPKEKMHRYDDENYICQDCWWTNIHEGHEGDPMNYGDS